MEEDRSKEVSEDEKFIEESINKIMNQELRSKVKVLINNKDIEGLIKLHNIEREKFLKIIKK